jgi:hypothetical protein
MPRPSRSFALLCALAALAGQGRGLAQTATIGGITYTHWGLVGVGRVAHDKKDKFGESFGSLSGLALDLRTVSLSASGSTYSATLYTQPDRGITRSGAATGYRPRRHKLTLAFNPDTNGSKNQDQLTLTLKRHHALHRIRRGLAHLARPVVLHVGHPHWVRHEAASGPQRPDLDRSRGIGASRRRHFFRERRIRPLPLSVRRRRLAARRDPPARCPDPEAQQPGLLLLRQRRQRPARAFAQPADLRPRQQQGLRGPFPLADGRTLYAFMQAATRQDDGGSSGGQNRYARLLAYDISTPSSPTLSAEWVLPLPTYTDSSKNQQIAEQHEIIALTGSNGTAARFLVLATDGTGRGNSPSNSLYRAVLIYDTTGATNIAGSSYDSASSPLAQNGILANNITPATSVVLVDLNDATQLAKFGLNNNASDNSDTLAGKWESLALLPSLDAGNPNDFFLLVGNDNDFSTSSGYMDGAAFSSSPNIDTMVLAYRVTLPGVIYTPIITTQPAAKTVTAGQAATLTAGAAASPAPSYQWSRNGVAIAGATAATITLTSAQPSDAGSYTVTVTNAAGSVTSSAATLTVSNVPAIATQPVSVTVVSGVTAVFSVTATNSPTSYQWRRNGVNVPSTTIGANGPTLLLTAATAAQAGAYTVVATNSAGSVTSNAATLTVAATGELIHFTNLSTLTDITSTVPTFTLGTVVLGTGTKPLVVRASGPTLGLDVAQGGIGVPGAIGDPKVDLLSGQTVVAKNDNWATPAYSGAPSSAEVRTAMASVGAFPFVAASGLDAAIYAPALPALGTSGYTVQVTGVNNSRGW